MSSSRTENLAAAHGGKASMVAIAGGALLMLGLAVNLFATRLLAWARARP